MASQDPHPKGRNGDEAGRDHRPNQRRLPTRTDTITVIPGRFREIINILGEYNYAQLRNAMVNIETGRTGDPDNDCPAPGTVYPMINKGGIRTDRYVRDLADILAIPVEIVDKRNERVFAQARPPIVWQPRKLTPVPEKPGEFEEVWITRQELDSYIEEAKRALLAVGRPRAELVAADPLGRQQGPTVLPIGVTAFDDFIEEKIEGFVGRKDLIAEIEAYVDPARNPHKRGYFIIEASPGVGKTSLLAHLIHKHGWEVHHFNRRAIGLVGREQFLGNICTRLMMEHGGEPHQPFPVTFNDPKYLEDLLTHLTSRDRFDPDRDRVVLAIDSLDEAEKAPPGQNTLGLPDRLPKGVYIVATSRPPYEDNTGQPDRVYQARTRETVYNLMVTNQSVTPKKVVPIKQSDRANIEDIKEYFAAQAKRPAIRKVIGQANWTNYLASRCRDTSPDERFTRLLTERSQGNFMYAFQVIGEIALGEAGLYGDPGSPNFHELPSGLNDYYKQHWSVMRGLAGDKWLSVYYPVIVGMLLCRRPTSAQILMLYALAYTDPRGLQAITEHQMARDLKLQEIRDALERWGQFLVAIERNGHIMFSLYHKSFEQFLEDHAGIDVTDATRKWVDTVLYDPDADNPLDPDADDPLEPEPDPIVPDNPDVLSGGAAASLPVPEPDPNAP